MSTAKSARDVTAAIYAGSSPSTSRTHLSVRKQVIDCWNFSFERGWTVKYVFIDLNEDESLASRTNFQKMIDDARFGKFDFVVLCRLKNLCSSPSDLANATRLLRQSGISFRNASDE